jgi:hypothetical protein
MAFQYFLFWLVDKRSVKTHVRTVVRIFRIWTGVPDVVYLAGNFCFANRKHFCFLNFQLCFTDKNFKQPNCFWLSMHGCRIYCYSVKLSIADLIRTKCICSKTQFSHIINRLLISLVRSVLWNIRPLFFCMDLAPSSLGPYIFHSTDWTGGVNNHLIHAYFNVSDDGKENVIIIYLIISLLKATFILFRSGAKSLSNIASSAGNCVVLQRY